MEGLGGSNYGKLGVLFHQSQLRTQTFWIRDRNL